VCLVADQSRVLLEEDTAVFERLHVLMLQFATFVYGPCGGDAQWTIIGRYVAEIIKCVPNLIWCVDNNLLPHQVARPDWWRSNFNTIAESMFISVEWTQLSKQARWFILNNTYICSDFVGNSMRCDVSRLRKHTLRHHVDPDCKCTLSGCEINKWKRTVDVFVNHLHSYRKHH